VGATRSAGGGDYNSFRATVLDMAATFTNKDVRAEAMRAWRARVDAHVATVFSGLGPAWAAVRTLTGMFLDKIAVAVGEKVHTQASIGGRGLALRYALKGEHETELDFPNWKGDWESLFARNSVSWIKDLFKQASALEEVVNADEAIASGDVPALRLVQLLAGAWSGPSRLDKYQSETAPWWYTEQTFLGRQGDLSYILNDTTKYTTTHTMNGVMVWIFYYYCCPKKWWYYVCTPTMFANVDSDFVQYVTHFAKRTTIHQAGFSSHTAALRDYHTNEQIMDAEVFRPNSQALLDDDDEVRLTVFEAARFPTRLTNYEHAALLANEQDILDAYEEFQHNHGLTYHLAWRR